MDNKQFVFDSPASIRKSREERQNMEENKHLALQFPIPELRYYFHPTFPGRWTLVHAQSHNFKTEWTNFWAKTTAVELAEEMKKSDRRGVIIKISTEDAIEALVESEIASFGGGLLEDIAQGIIKNPERFVRAENIVGGLPIVHVGESLGMDESNSAMLTLTNIAKLIHYVKYEHFKQETPIAAIFCDYLQALPFDTAVAGAKNMTDSRTLQINRDVETFRRIIKQNSCPGVMVAQSNPDEQLSTIGDSIKLPGYWDTHWSKYPPQRADFMYSLWMPKMHYPIGDTVPDRRRGKNEIESNQMAKWNFRVEPDMLWVKCLKHKKFPNVGASFPLKVSENNNVSFNSELYEKIKRMEKI